MLIGCCTNCRYLDLRDNFEGYLCPRCNSRFVSLGITSAQWNKLGEEESEALINRALGDFSHQYDADAFDEDVFDAGEESVPDDMPEESEPVDKAGEGVFDDDSEESRFTENVRKEYRTSYKANTKTVGEQPQVDIGYNVKTDMIDCPECEYRVMKGTRICPKCGYKLDRNESILVAKIKKWLLPTVVALAFIAVVLFFLFY